MPIYPQAQLDQLVQLLMVAQWLRFNASMKQQLPEEGGIYRISDMSQTPPTEIYIVISENLRRRIYSNHFTGSTANSTLTRKLVNARLLGDVEAVHSFLAEKCAVQLITITDARLRCFAEHYAVAVLQPPHNDSMIEREANKAMHATCEDARA